MSEEKIVRLGSHLPLLTRRVVTFCHEYTTYQTPIGLVEGMADGAICIRDPSSTETDYELTVVEARALAQALSRAAAGVEQWQVRASGFNKIRVARSPSGEVTVTCHGRTRPMRLSKLRGQRGGHNPGRLYRRCDECNDTPPMLYIAADDLREGGLRVQHVEVCVPCVDKLANIPEQRAAIVTPLKPATTG